jgi:hypothetical protein
VDFRFADKDMRQQCALGRSEILPHHRRIGRKLRRVERDLDELAAAEAVALIDRHRRVDLGEDAVVAGADVSRGRSAAKGSMSSCGCGGAFAMMAFFARQCGPRVNQVYPIFVCNFNKVYLIDFFRDYMIYIIA